MSVLNRISGIRGKVIGIVLVVTLMLSILTIVYIQTTLQSALAEQLEQKAVSIARDVASRSIDMILSNNFYTMHRLARDTMENNQDVSYVIFLQNDKVLADTFLGGFPTDLAPANPLTPDKRFSLARVQTEEGILRDVAVPVLGMDGVVVRVGVLDHSIKTTLSSATRQLLLISALTFLLGSFTAYLLTTLIVIRPISILSKSVQDVSRGDLTRQVRVKSHDELSELAGAFNTMVKRLATAHRVRNRLLKKIIHTQEEERRRIARELHDETGQTLMTLMIALSQIEDSETVSDLKKYTREFRTLLLHTLESVRLLAWKLSPIPLADLGLKAAVELFIKKYSRNDNWKIEFQADGFDKKRLSPEIETAVYRVVQEALTNAAKHAQARNVSVIMKCDDQNVVVIIEDDGNGFDVSAVKEEGIFNTCLGLASMDERISLVGGTLNIESAAHGTTIYIKIPLNYSGGD
ncbi:MAG: HAMP domain-containing protein [Dethiobacter sp.]|nr:HAMP domain-containing protein [Dethiobacter sp.]